MGVFSNRFDHEPAGFKPFHEKKLKIAYLIDFCHFFLENGPVFVKVALKRPADCLTRLTKRFHVIFMIKTSKFSSKSTQVDPRKP